MAKVVETQSNLERQLELVETHQQEVVSFGSYLYFLPDVIVSIIVYHGAHGKKRVQVRNKDFRVYAKK